MTIFRWIFGIVILLAGLVALVGGVVMIVITIRDGVAGGREALMAIVQLIVGGGLFALGCFVVPYRRVSAASPRS